MKIVSWLKAAVGLGPSSPPPPPPGPAMPMGMALVAEDAEGTSYYEETESVRREMLIPKSFPGVLARQGYPAHEGWDDPTPMFAAERDTSDSAMAQAEAQIARLKKFAKLWRDSPGFAAAMAIPRVLEVPRQPGQETFSQKWAKMSARERADAMGLEWTTIAETIPHLQWVSGLDSALAAQLSARLHQHVSAEVITTIRENLSRD